MLSDWRMRVRSLLARRAVEQDLDGELAFHLEQEVAKHLRRGLSREEAVRLARIDLGGIEQTREAHRDARGTRWLEDLWHDVRYALRALRRRPGFTAVALGTLALGSGAVTIMFAVVNGVLLTPLDYPNPGRLMTVHDWTGRFGDQPWFSYPNFLDLQRASRSLSPMAAWRSSGGTISQPGQARYVEGLEVSSGFFDVLGVPLTAGRDFRVDEDRPGGAPVAIISAALWKRRYGGRPDAIGSRLVLDGRPLTVIGVAPPPGPPVDGADVFTPLGQEGAPFMRNREASPGIRVVARLAAGATVGASNAELALIAHDLAVRYPAANAGRRFTAKSLSLDIVGDV
jgi:putative ABC transport system permease protein